MTSTYGTILSSHNGFRWIILALFFITLALLIKNKLTSNRYSESTTKFLKFTMIASDIQLLLGIVLYFFASPLTEAARASIANAMKIKELRFFIAEHPFAMVLFWILIHVAVVVSKKDRPEPKKINTLLVIYVFALLCLLGGMPWFRPLLRF